MENEILGLRNIYVKEESRYLARAMNTDYYKDLYSFGRVNCSDNVVVGTRTRTHDVAALGSKIRGTTDANKKIKIPMIKDDWSQILT